jgi:hypothetical protein
VPAPDALRACDDALLDPVVPAVLLADAAPMEALVRMKSPLLALRDELADPLVPVALSDPRCRQPVIVIIRADELCVDRVLWLPGGVEFCGGACDGGFCAMTTAAKPTVSAAHVPDHILLVIFPPWRFTISASAVQLSDQRQPVGRLRGSWKRSARRSIDGR